MDRSFGVLLMAGALTALWLYDTGRLPAVWAIIQAGPGAKPGVSPPATPGSDWIGSVFGGANKPAPTGMRGPNTAAPPSMGSITPRVSPNQGSIPFFPEGG